MRRLVLLIWLALIGLQLALGATWIARNIDRIPDYGDTGDYLQLARTLEVDAYRGVAYPAFIAAVDRMPGGAGLLRSANKAVGLKVKAGVLYLQVIQCLASLAALYFFLRTFLAPTVPRPTASPPTASQPTAPLLARCAGGLTLLLLWLDPLVAHFGLAIMTDSLASSSSLAFCAAFAAFGLGKTRRALYGLVLFASFVLTASLRVEKLAVLACATMATLAAWLFLQRGIAPEERRFSPARALEIAGIVAAGSVVVLALHRGAQSDGRRWPFYDSLVHSRIVFPNLSKVYDELPKKFQSRVSRKDAERHDTDSIVGYRVINDATGASGPIRVRDREEAARTGVRPSAERERRATLEQIAGIVLRERWPELAADVLKDALENTLSTFSFYVRLAVLARTGDVSCADGTQKTYEVLSKRRPRTSLLWVSASAAVFVASTVLAAAALLRRRSVSVATGAAAPVGTPLVERRTLVKWVPVAAFVLANACAFALRADMVHIRYMLLAHVAYMALAYRGALEWLLAERVRSPAAA